MTKPNKIGLRAGVSEVKITPPAVGTFLLGPLEPSTGVHDELFARALVLDDGKKRVAIVTMDLGGLDFTMVQEMRTEIERQTGIPDNRIMLNCSHTHSAPLTIHWYESGWKAFKENRKKWRSELLNKVATTVKFAVSNLQDAKLRFGREPVQIGFNRRFPTEDSIVMKPNHKGTVVPWVDVLRVDGGDNKPISILFSHAAHPVIVHGASTLISADYSGYAVSTVKSLLGKNMIAMFAQGCGGNINGEPLRGGFNKAKEAGTILGNAAVKAANESQPLPGNNLRSFSLELQLPFQKPPIPEECKKVLRIYEDEYEEARRKKGVNEKSLWYARNIVLVLHDLLKIAKKGERRSLKFEIQSFAIGNEFCTTGMTHEMFAEYQLWLNEVSPFSYNMVFGYTNGCESYIPCEKDFALGGYEAGAFPTPCAPLAYHNRLTLEPQIEGQIKAGLKELLQSLNQLN